VAVAGHRPMRAAAPPPTDARERSLLRCQHIADNAT
jgi:hypothetical protein